MAQNHSVAENEEYDNGILKFSVMPFQIQGSKKSYLKINQFEKGGGDMT